MQKTVLFLFAILLGIHTISAQDHASDIKGVEEACYDYINAFYKADTTLAYKSVHKTVRKAGFYFDKEKSEYTDKLEMPFNDLVGLAKKWNADGTQANESTPKNVEIFEVSDKTASAKVSAVWGIDYMSLAKIDDKWMIVNVLWQSPPKFTTSGSN